MNEEERSNLYIYTYSDLDDDFVFAETKYTLGDLHKLQQENQLLQELMSNNKRISNVAEKRYEKILELEEEIKKYKENYECILKQRNDITKNATEQIESLIDEKNKYKSLYQNEKDHTDTLKRIIKKIEEILQNEYKENIFGHYEYDLTTAKNTIKKILDLLKEIK